MPLGALQQIHKTANCGGRHLWRTRINLEFSITASKYGTNGGNIILTLTLISVAPNLAALTFAK
jgi:hypothetical protein